MTTRDILRRKKEELGVSTPQLAEYFGIKRAYMYVLISEASEVAIPRKVVLGLYQLGVSADQLLQGELNMHPELRIYKDVPVPPAHVGRYPVSRSTLEKMEVGDSVLFDERDENGRYVAEAKNFAQKYRTAAQKMGIAITVRMTPEGLRLWRVR